MLHIKRQSSPWTENSDPLVNTWILVKKDDCQIEAVDCIYMAGMGGDCSHIAAILFKVEASIRKHITTAITDVANKWNNAYRKK